MHLPSQKTYIVPTGFGFAFGLIALVLLVMAIGYGNNLLYFFVFLLISMALSGMWLTNKNIESFEVSEVLTTNIFANEINHLELKLKNKDAQSAVWDVQISIADKAIKNKIHTVDEIRTDEVSKSSFVDWRPQFRGQFQRPRILIQSEFPFRMLRAWKYYGQPEQIIIFPERKGQTNIPVNEGRKLDEQQMAQLENQGLFRDYREFQKSDSPQRIDWKRSLKHQKHFVKNFEVSGEEKVLIDWEMTSFLTNFEDRVSQMALWVDNCQKKNNDYSLRIAHLQTEYLSHQQHYKDCMTTLALLKPEDIL